MFRKEPRRVTSDQSLETSKMIAIERPVGADRQSDAMERQGTIFADRRQIAMRRPARAHIVFGVDLEEADVGQRLHDRAIVLGLEADAGARRNAALRGGRP